MRVRSRGIQAPLIVYIPRGAPYVEAGSAKARLTRKAIRNAYGFFSAYTVPPAPGQIGWVHADIDYIRFSRIGDVFPLPVVRFDFDWKG